MTQSYEELFEQREVDLAEMLVRRAQEEIPLLQREGFEDLVQECLIRWYQRKRDYDPDRGRSLKSFESLVIKSRITELIREKKALKRKINYVAESLDKTLGGEDDSRTLKNVVPDDAQNRAAPTDLSIDLSRVLNVLTPRQKDIYGLLFEGYSTSEAARILDTPRSTLNDEIRRIRKIFEKKGLREYISDFPDSPPKRCV